MSQPGSSQGPPPSDGPPESTPDPDAQAEQSTDSLTADESNDNDPVGAGRQRWHSASWWAGIGGIVGVLSLFVAIGAWKFPGSDTTPQTASPIAGFGAVAEENPRELPFTFTSEESQQDGADYVYIFRGRAPEGFFGLYDLRVVAVPPKSSSGETFWRVSPPPSVEGNDRWTITWRTPTSLEGLTRKVALWVGGDGLLGPLCLFEGPNPNADDYCGLMGMEPDARTALLTSVTKKLEEGLTTKGLCFAQYVIEVNQPMRPTHPIYGGPCIIDQ